MKLVFEQQQKAMTDNKHGYRWHPVFNAFCLSIKAKSTQKECKESRWDPLPTT